MQSKPNSPEVKEKEPNSNGKKFTISISIKPIEVLIEALEKLPGFRKFGKSEVIKIIFGILISIVAIVYFIFGEGDKRIGFVMTVICLSSYLAIDVIFLWARKHRRRRP